MASVLSHIIHLGWRKERKKESQKIDNLPVLATCRSGTLSMLSSKVNGPVAHGSTRYGSWRPLTNLAQTFRVCHLCTFNVAAIFFWVHPYIWRTTVCHNTIAKLQRVTNRESDLSAQSIALNISIAINFV